MIEVSTTAVGSILLTLRLAPTLAFAPPFSLVRIPLLARLTFGLGMAVAMVAAHSVPATLADIDVSTLAAAATRELMLGLTFVLALQLAFGGLYVAGRTVDVQAGYGLTLLIDPSSQNQTPLVGTLFALATGAIFFAFDGHLALFRLISATMDVVPLGSWSGPRSIDRVGLLMTTTLSIALGFAGGVIGCLFLIDLAIAFVSRTVPQMNVLVLGFQIKTLALLMTLPLLFSLESVLLVRMSIVAIEAIPGLI